MSNDVVIRDARQGDVETLAEIANAAWAPLFEAHRKAMGEELFAAAVPDWRQRKGKEIRTACEPGSPTFVCVAEKEGRVVGFVTFRIDKNSRIGVLCNNAVHPDFQGMGIGTRMYRHALDRFRELGMRFAKVGTGGDDFHAPARKAYEKAGFSIQFPWVEYYCKL